MGSGAGSGTIRAAIDTGGPVMVSGYRTTTTPPLVVAVSLDRNEVLADWRHQARTSALMGHRPKGAVSVSWNEQAPERSGMSLAEASGCLGGARFSRSWACKI